MESPSFSLEDNDLESHVGSPLIKCLLRRKMEKLLKVKFQSKGIDLTVTSSLRSEDISKSDL